GQPCPLAVDLHVHGARVGSPHREHTPAVEHGGPQARVTQHPQRVLHHEGGLATAGPVATVTCTTRTRSRSCPGGAEATPRGGGEGPRARAAAGPPAARAGGAGGRAARPAAA